MFPVPPVNSLLNVIVLSDNVDEYEEFDEENMDELGHLINKEWFSSQLVLIENFFQI